MFIAKLQHDPKGVDITRVCYIYNILSDSEMDFYSASSLKQQSADRHVTPIGHINLIPSHLVFARSP
jgi:hypothetical protein